jgi:hypothetical protein
LTSKVAELLQRAQVDEIFVVEIRGAETIYCSGVSKVMEITRVTIYPVSACPIIKHQRFTDAVIV